MGQEKNPTDRVNVSFRDYVRNKMTSQERHLVKGIPDYAYAMDCELRKKMMEIPGFQKLCRTMLATVVPREMNRINLEGLAVGPGQFPEVYEMGVECSRVLGIGIPGIFIVNDSSVNAYTIATDDTTPIVVLHSGLYERMTPGELRAVIGHECGHIHNGHTLFTYIIAVLISEFASGSGGASVPFLTFSALALLKSWYRAAEVTADRAALICSCDFEDAVGVNKKLLYGAAFGEHEVQLEPIRKQFEKIKNTPVRYLELGTDHPVPARRIFADLEFLECETLYRWRPEKKTPGILMRSKEETDQRCARYIAVSEGR